MAPRVECFLARGHFVSGTRSQGRLFEHSKMFETKPQSCALSNGISCRQPLSTDSQFQRRVASSVKRNDVSGLQQQKVAELDWSVAQLNCNGNRQILDRIKRRRGFRRCYRHLRR